MICKECGERIVQRSEIWNMCDLCYAVLDMDRFKEARVRIKDEPVYCERCRDTGRVLVRDKKNPGYMYVRNCPECNARGTK